MISSVQLGMYRSRAGRAAQGFTCFGGPFEQLMQKWGANNTDHCLCSGLVSSSGWIVVFVVYVLSVVQDEGCQLSRGKVSNWCNMCRQGYPFVLYQTAQRMHTRSDWLVAG